MYTALGGRVVVASLSVCVQDRCSFGGQTLYHETSWQQYSTLAGG